MMVSYRRPEATATSQLIILAFHSTSKSITSQQHKHELPRKPAEMASMTMTASFLAGSTMAKQPSAAPRRGLIVAKASTGMERERVGLEMNKEESSKNGRRDLVFAGVAAVAFSIAKVAMADEPKRGTPEAKKKYAPICVTMPTARICRK